MDIIFIINNIKTYVSKYKYYNKKNRLLIIEKLNYINLCSFEPMKSEIIN